MLKSHLEAGALSSIKLLILSNYDELYLYKRLRPLAYTSIKKRFGFKYVIDPFDKN
jgi:hypothetical protein